MNFAIDSNNRSPIYRQLQDQIRYAISVGELVPGDALPSIRGLETELGVNRNTVRRAYMELQAEGMLVVRQGREARVAPRPPNRLTGGGAERAGVVGELTALMLHRAASAGVDAVLLAEHFVNVARDHDRMYPRCGFLECSRRQAQDFAQRTERAFGRRVVAINLHDLGREPNALPASVRFVLTPHWHSADAREALRLSNVEVFDVGVRLTSACIRRLTELRGTSIGLIVRDVESAPGYRERLRQHVGTSNIRVAVAGDVSGVGALMRTVESVVFTPPCADIAQSIASERHRVCELGFEPLPEDLNVIRDRILPALPRVANVA